MTEKISNQDSRTATRRTLIERLVRLIPLPYWASSLILSILLGPPIWILIYYLGGGNINESLQAYFREFLPGRPWQQYTAIILWVGVNLYAFLMIHFIQGKINSTKPKITPLLPHGEDQFRRAFKRLTDTLPPLLISIMMMIGFSQFISGGLDSADNTPSLIYQYISIPFQYFLYGTAVWVYLSALWGLYRTGRGPLQLQPYYKDSSLGALPLGVLSLNISSAYFMFLGILVLIALVSPIAREFSILLVILLLLGVGMFFLPLYSTHNQMKTAKEKHLSEINQKLIHIVTAMESINDKKTDPGITSIQPVLSYLTGVQALQILEQRADKVSTWPVDTDLLGRLTAIIIPILIGIATQYFITVLNI